MRNPFRYSGPIEWGFLVPLIIVLVIMCYLLLTTPTHVPPPLPAWHCPQGTVMIETSNFYAPVQPACVAGTYATR